MWVRTTTHDEAEILRQSIKINDGHVIHESGKNEFIQLLETFYAVTAIRIMLDVTGGDKDVEDIRKGARGILRHRDDILLAYLFGSVASHDVDVAVLLKVENDHKN